MIDEFITFFFAGHETTSSTLGFFFLEVGRYPEIFQKYIPKSLKKNFIDYYY
jgi:cytochrome P450